MRAPVGPQSAGVVHSRVAAQVCGRWGCGVEDGSAASGAVESVYGGVHETAVALRLYEGAPAVGVETRLHNTGGAGNHVSAAGEGQVAPAPDLLTSLWTRDNVRRY